MSKHNPNYHGSGKNGRGRSPAPMSLQKKMELAMTKAATEAVARERGRALWCLDQIIERVEFQVSQKLLIEAERHTVEVKLRLTRSIVDTAKRMIVGGSRPKQTFAELLQPNYDLNEMQERNLALMQILMDLGWGEESTLADVREQIEEWEAQEDKIEELEARLADAEEQG